MLVVAEEQWLKSALEHWLPVTVLRISIRKVSYEAHNVSVFPTIQEKTLLYERLKGFTKVIISGHVPGLHMCASHGPGSCSKCFKTKEVRWSCYD